MDLLTEEDDSAGEVSGQVELHEEYDPNYEPTEDGRATCRGWQRGVYEIHFALKGRIAKLKTQLSDKATGIKNR